MGLVVCAVDLVDMEPFGVQTHIEVAAAIPGSGVCP
jgi:hypothetical protein